MPVSASTLATQLHAEVTAATGLDDFGDPDYRIGLGEFLGDLVATPGLDEQTVDAVARVVAGPILADRVHTERARRAHGAALTRTTNRPVFITGIPRSGTTALHQILAADPRFQVVEKWLINDPQPRPPRSTWSDIAGHQQAIAMLDYIPESLRRSHFVHPDDADECLVPMAQSFVSNWFGSMASVPAYDKWFLEQDMTASLRRYAEFLDLLGASSPERTWLLKNPSHTLCLDELFAVFPDAVVIQTHRNPYGALASVSSTIAAGGEFVGHQRPLPVIAIREIELWSEAMRRSSAARPGRESAFFDVDYREFVADPAAMAKRIYEAFGWDLSEQAEAAMAQWVSDNPRNRHGQHTYDADAIGIDRDLVEANFGTYIEEYDLQ